MALDISLRKALMYAGIAINVARIALIPTDANIDALASPPTQETGAVRQIEAADALPGDLLAVLDSKPTGREALGILDANIDALASPPTQETEAVRQIEAVDVLPGDLLAVLDSIPTGREALGILEEFDIEVRFELSLGSYFKTPDNFVVMGLHESPEAAALTLVHEMSHAEAYITGAAPNPKTLSRASYVQRNVAEETEAVLRAIRASFELRQAGLDSPGAPLESTYRAAVGQALKLRSAGQADLGAEEIAELEARAGNQRVIEAFMNGEVIGSSSGETYPRSSGMSWDRVRDAA